MLKELLTEDEDLLERLGLVDGELLREGDGEAALGEWASAEASFVSAYVILIVLISVKTSSSRVEES